MPSNFKFDETWSVDSVMAKDFSVRHAKIFGGAGFVPVDPKSLAEAGKKLYFDALDTMTYAAPKSEGGNVEMFLGKDDLQDMGAVDDIKDENLADRIRKLVDKNFLVSMTAFLAQAGSVSSARYWILVDENCLKFGDIPCHLYVALPELLVANKGSLQIAFSGFISKMLMAGGETSVSSYCSRAGIYIPKGKKKYCFPKGMHVSGFPIEDVKDFKNDMSRILNLMNKKRDAVVEASDKKMDFFVD